jgi:hypothetical protein
MAIELTGEAAQIASFSPILVRAIIQVESGGNPWAWNPEPRYRYLWNVKTKRPFRQLTVSESLNENPPADFPIHGGDRDQEWWGQQASWGLMQVMGAVAREQGFSGIYLTELCDPVTNLTSGCAHLRGLLKWANNDIPQAVAGYNAGRGNWRSEAGTNYAAKILAMMNRG